MATQQEKWITRNGRPVFIASVGDYPPGTGEVAESADEHEAAASAHKDAMDAFEKAGMHQAADRHKVAMLAHQKAAEAVRAAREASTAANFDRQDEAARRVTGGSGEMLYLTTEGKWLTEGERHQRFVAGFKDEILLEAASKEPYGDVTYADPGYQSDKKKRYPLDTEEHIRAAWDYIHQEKNSGQYSSSQASAIKSRIIGAWKRKIDKSGPPSAKKEDLDAHEGLLLLEAWITTKDGRKILVGEPGEKHSMGEYAEDAEGRAEAVSGKDHPANGMREGHKEAANIMRSAPNRDSAIGMLKHAAVQHEKQSSGPMAAHHSFAAKVLRGHASRLENNEVPERQPWGYT